MRCPLILVAVTERSRGTRNFKGRLDNGINHAGGYWENERREEMMWCACSLLTHPVWILFCVPNLEPSILGSSSAKAWFAPNEFLKHSGFVQCSEQSIFFMLCKPHTSHTSCSNYMFNVGLNYVFYCETAIAAVTCWTAHYLNFHLATLLILFKYTVQF